MDKNGVKYTIDYIPRNTRQRRPGNVRQPKTLTIHSTANPTSTARNERAWLTNPANTAPYTGWHIVVDDREAIEAIPLNEKAFHAGDGSGPGNSFSIGLEICESGDRAKTIENAAHVAAAILKEQGLAVADLRQHYDWSKKNCPRILRTGNLWREFVAAVELHYGGGIPIGGVVVRGNIIDSRMIDGKAFVALRPLCEELGIPLRWNGKYSEVG